MGNDPEALEDRFHPAPTSLEKICMALCAVSIVVMGIIVITEIVTRNLFGFSFEVSEELGGYIIVGISFISLPVCQVYRAYHHVQFLQTRLSPRLQALSHLIFDILSLLFCLVLLWQLTRFVMASYRSGDEAPTTLGNASVDSLDRRAVGYPGCIHFIDPFDARQLAAIPSGWGLGRCSWQCN